MSSTPVAAAPAEGGASEAEEAHLLPRPQPQPEPASLGPPAASDAANIGAEAVAKPAAHVPCFAWAILGASVTAVSSAAAVFQSMQEVPPLVLTAWRLSLTSCIIFPAAAVSFHKLPPEDQRRAVRNLHILLAGSLLLAVHFACFVWGLMHTSLTHCLLYASSTPLIIAGATWVLRRPISAGELLGTGLGMLGAVLLASGATADRQVTFAGDMASLASAACFVVYLSIGQHLRSWMPLFVFAWPVVASAASLLSLAAVVVDGVTLTGAGMSGLYGWVRSPYMSRMVYLAIVPGIIGHVGFNAVIKWINPLIVSLALTLEPLLGSLIGFAVGLVQPPSMWTYAGGTVLLGATVWVTVASHRREEAQRAQQAVNKCAVVELEQQRAYKHDSSELPV